MKVKQAKRTEFYLFILLKINNPPLIRLHIMYVYFLHANRIKINFCVLIHPYNKNLEISVQAIRENAITNFSVIYIF